MVTAPGTSSQFGSALVVIDPNVTANPGVLAARISPGASMLVFENSQNAIEQIGAALKQFPQITAVHLVASGMPGTLSLGGDLLSLETIDRYAEVLKTWQVKSIDIYSYFFGFGSAGRELMEKLHQSTGASIRTHTTVNSSYSLANGNYSLDGDWQLEAMVPAQGGQPQNSLPQPTPTIPQPPIVPPLNLNLMIPWDKQPYPGIVGSLHVDDYAALKALYLNTDGTNWRLNLGWRDWDFSSPTPPDLSIVYGWNLTGNRGWYGVTIENGRVTGLRLDNNGLRGAIPPEIGKLGKLESLTLEYNELGGTIPPELGNLGKLRSLFLSNTQLSGTIPPEIGKLSELATLWLSDNQLSGTLPVELANLSKLFSLNLSNNQLSQAVPRAVFNRLNRVYDLGSNRGLYDATTGEFVISDALLRMRNKVLDLRSEFRSRKGAASQADELRGRSSNDAVWGLGGNDRLQGGGGNDYLSGDTGKDILEGGTGNDLTSGGRGNDILSGGTGNDVLLGRQGTDRITTGSGRDKVSFEQVTNGKSADVITDFNPRADQIVISAAGFGGGLVAEQPIRSEQFQLGRQAIGAEAQFLYDRRTGTLFFDTDGVGASQAIEFAQVQAGLNLRSQNFLVL
ncbi:DUF4347 domain-containing protein [Leptolyngbya ohadii]|uniref:DUF4347 domain-containing protein n=1 Tax=Leptolyngbya ohadii TaxID=1962290 RepID=UPI000B59FBA1|nr:DUF4347 domain-containing protein [Leptolyngbya ohadii]